MNGKNILMYFLKTIKFVAEIGFHVVVIMTPIIALFGAMRTDPSEEHLKQLGYFFVCWLFFVLYYSWEVADRWESKE